MRSRVKDIAVVLRRINHLSEKLESGKSHNPPFDAEERLSLTNLIDDYREHISADIVSAAEARAQRRAQIRKENGHAHG